MQLRSDLPVLRLLCSWSRAEQLTAVLGLAELAQCDELEKNANLFAKQVFGTLTD